MRSKFLKYISIIVLAVFIVWVIIYLAMMRYYRFNFPVNTWINGIYCTGKTVEEVNTELLQNTEAPVLTIVGKDGRKEQIILSEVGYQEDYLEHLQSYKQEQSTVLWTKYLVKSNQVTILPMQSFDKEVLKKLILQLDIVQAEICEEESVDVKIIYGENGYELYDGLQQVFDPDKFTELVIKNIENGVYITDIAASNCYFVQEDSPEQKATRDLWQKLEKFLSLNLTYDMGAEQIVFDSSLTSQFVLLDDSGDFLLDSTGSFLWDTMKIEAFVDELAEKYNTCDTTLSFQATSGITVEVPYVTYGTEIDSKKEKEYLIDALNNRIGEVHIPAYIQEGYVRGLNDIGDTYIEVDMTEQKLYGYKAGELIVETDIVTGNMKRKWDTPVGVNFVYNKQKNRVLRGQNYATPVDFWMPVKGAIGIHDADWRDEFGGDIYLKNGSHGCINVPVDVMPTVYEEFEIGTPVIMFY